MKAPEAWVSDRVAAAVALSLAFAVPMAMVLSLFGVHGSFLARVGAALTLEYVLVYGVAEGVEIAFDRCFAEPEVALDPAGELPEVEQQITGS